MFYSEGMERVRTFLMGLHWTSKTVWIGVLAAGALVAFRTLVLN